MTTKQLKCIKPITASYTAMSTVASVRIAMRYRKQAEKSEIPVKPQTARTRGTLR
jgi:hypothetical protein